MVKLNSFAEIKALFNIDYNKFFNKACWDIDINLGEFGCLIKEKKGYISIGKNLISITLANTNFSFYDSQVDSIDIEQDEDGVVINIMLENTSNQLYFSILF